MKMYFKNGLSFIISLISMFLILILSSSLFLDKIILNEKTYTNIFEKEKIYEQVEAYINENISYLLLSNNIPEDTLEGIISQKEIKNIFYDYIDNTIEFMKNEADKIELLDTSIYKERINEKISDFLRENKMYLGSEFNDNIEEFKGTIINIIKNSFEIINLNILSNSSTVKRISKIISFISGNIFLGLLIVGLIIVNGLQFIIWRKDNKIKKYLWIGYPFMSSGMIMFLIGFSGYLSGFYKNIPIGIVYLKNAMIGIMEKYLLSFANMGLVLIFIGILFIIRYWKYLFKSYLI